MISVWKFTKKKAQLVGRYEGLADNMKDISNALDAARKVCPKGKLIIGGVNLPERRKKEPELK